MGRRPQPSAAVTVALPGGTGPHDAVDPVALAGGRGWLFAGPALTLAALGTARVLPMARGLADAAARARLAEVLARSPCRDEVGRPGTGVVALGALPFDPDEPATLTVPATIYGRDRDGEWVTVVFSDAAPPRLRGPRPSATASYSLRPGTRGTSLPPPARLGATLQARPSGAGYAASVAAAVAAMAVRALDQGRPRPLPARPFDRPLGPGGRARTALRPGAVVHGVRLAAAGPGPRGRRRRRDGDGVGRFLGASPELLLARAGSAATCLAPPGRHGRARRTGGGGRRPGGERAARLGQGPRASTGSWSRHIARALTPRCRSLDVPDRPRRWCGSARWPTSAPRIEGTLRRRSAGRAPVLELLAALHPTPAVGGVPRRSGAGLIRSSEAVAATTVGRRPSAGGGRRRGRRW